jgi:Ca2+-binding EF-hand superfamily protein
MSDLKYNQSTNLVFFPGVLTEEAFTEVCYEVATQQRADGVVGPRADREHFAVVLQRLFEVFDSDGDNVVDFQELAAGLSVLCGGDRDAKAEAAFALYDFNEDGFISLGEMERYLSAVFSLMYAVQPETQGKIGVDAKQLAKQTASEIFQEADKTKRGRLNFAEFKAWYEKPTAQHVNEVVQHITHKSVSLIDIVRLSGLEYFPPAYAFEQFALMADEAGVLNRTGFFHVFNKLASQTRSLRSKEDNDKLRVVLSRLFDVFDTNGDGTIDFAELASGVSVLCGGDMDTKAEACFSLFDFNGDGVIEFEEMARYLKSVYMTVFLLKPDCEAAKTGMDPETLAVTTAQNIFKRSMLTDGRLGYAAFRKWFTSSSRKDAIPTLQSLLSESDIPLVPHHGSFALARRGPREMVAANDSHAAPRSAVPLETLDLLFVKEITGLNKLDSEQCFEELAHAVNDQGKLEKAAFVAVLSRISGRNQMNSTNRQVFHAVVDAIFRAFVSDEDQQADFAELASGISVLCGGSSDDKAEAAFSLYDINGDNFIVPSEMVKYLGSVYKLIYQFQPGVGMKQSNLSPEHLALVTTQQIFLDADTDNDGRLSFEEFQRWYASSNEDANTSDVSTDDDDDDDDDDEEVRIVIEVFHNRAVRFYVSTRRTIYVHWYSSSERATVQSANYLMPPCLTYFMQWLCDIET